MPQSSIYPVILCGGSGTRLWPASRRDRPKQFIPLIGERSTFQETFLRASGIEGVRTPVVIANHAHRSAIEAQLAELKREAVLLLEPEPRDSAPAMAAAAAWIAAEDPDGVAVFLSADHHIPDASAFQASASMAVEAAREGAIVTLGVKPTAPSTAFGYIRPDERPGEVKPVAAFVEKPDGATALKYVDDGYLWNSGNFVALASTLLEELDTYLPEVTDAARDAVARAERSGPALLLAPPFLTAPKISIDYAVMEKTRRAAVLPVDFEWRDIGAWDAVWSSLPKDADGNAVMGAAMLKGVSDSLVRVTGRRQTAVIGLKEVAVVIDDDSVLVCGLPASQDVKLAGERYGSIGSGPRFRNLGEAAEWHRSWLRTAALPLWWTVGADHEHGGFLECLTVSGEPAPAPRRARVQARQAWVYATAYALGMPGPWRQAAWHGMKYLLETYGRGPGRIASLVRPDGAPSDDTVLLYDLAFALLAMAALQRADPATGDIAAEVAPFREVIQHLRHENGGFREAGAHPFQSNAQMHLLEAALAWEESGLGGWGGLADEIVTLALARLIDDRGGFLREYFDTDWRPTSGDDGRFLEPGHQFEWAWLLERWGRARGRDDARKAARKLYACGLRGIDSRRGVVVNALWDDMSIRDASARLWPQTEWLKAALILGDEAQALAAAHSIAAYLDVPARGAWRDKLRPDGVFVAEPAPASSFYHIVCATQELIQAAQAA